MASDISQVFYMAGVLVIIGGIFLVARFSTCRRQVLRLELQRPLLEEAEGGYTVCAACEFENFKRFAYCTLCGKKLPVSLPSESKTSDRGETKEGNQQRKETIELNDRQLRARKRKQWTRKVDVEGKLFWYRSASDEDAEAQYPGYIVRFKTPVRDEGGDDVEQIAEKTENDLQAHEEEITIHTNEFESKPYDGSTGRRSLLQMDSTIIVELVDAVLADPAVFATNPTPAIIGIERAKEAVAFASNDFPTKYAHFVVTTASLITPVNGETLKLSVHRDYVLEESIDRLYCIEEKNMRLPMRIDFVDESGVDAGGIHREWFLLVNETLMDSTLRLFLCVNKEDQSYYLNPNSLADIGEDHLTFYYTIGRLVGRALLEGFVWGFHLSLPLLKMILGMPVTFSDMEYFDPETHKSMVWLLENDGVEALGLDFSMTEMHGDEIVIVDLIPNGRNIDVTDANKHEYLDRKFKYMLFERVSDQLYSFLRGVYEIIPPDLLMMFDPEEFDYLLCGTQEIDVADWKANTTHPLNITNLPLFRWFWEIVEDMPNEYRRRLLLFATGSSRVPLAGFRGLTSYDGKLCKFNLKMVSYYTTEFIRSHACFNRLEIPVYRTKEELKRVLYATLETDEYGFTTI